MMHVACVMKMRRECFTPARENKTPPMRAFVHPSAGAHRCRRESWGPLSGRNDDNCRCGPFSHSRHSHTRKVQSLRQSGSPVPFAISRCATCINVVYISSSGIPIIHTGCLRTKFANTWYMQSVDRQPLGIDFAKLACSLKQAEASRETIQMGFPSFSARSVVFLVGIDCQKMCVDLGSEIMFADIFLLW